MKVYVTARFNSTENQAEIEALCRAVRRSGMQDFCFIRDVEKYQKTFEDPKELWQRALDELKQCDALLIDISDSPSGGRVVEAGIAYALGMKIFVTAKKGTEMKGFYRGIATTIIEYDGYEDIALQLKLYKII